MKDMFTIEDKETLKYVIRHELKSLGIKVPKEKRISVRCTQGQGKERSTCKTTIFGSALEDIPNNFISKRPGCLVPKFLVECVHFLEDNVESEGLFRKPGSRIRQKELQLSIENGKTIPSNASVNDVAGLFKLFFRELPEPLFSGKLAEALSKCCQLSDTEKRCYAMRLLCLTLPSLHLSTLCFILEFMKKVAANADTNKMDASNLALVMMPNLMRGFRKEKSNTATIEKFLKLQTAVVKHLIENADDLGMVPDAVLEKLDNFGNRSSDLLDWLTSEDELDKSDEATLEERKKHRRRRRSGPIQGLMSGIGQSLGLLKSGAGSATVKTPAVDEIIENPTFLGETPRILRSSKRKASDDLSTLASVKRKAMLHQMTSDPHYSKPGLNLHKEGRHQTVTDSPITPIRPTKPALGEVDAITEDGSTVFKFQTPSIKFADESFATFSATPAAGCVDTTGGMSEKKSGKLKKQTGKKYKRRSGVTQVDMSTPRSARGSNTPKSGSVYNSIKKRLGHKHTHTQPTPISLNDMPDKSVGWRLANPPTKDGKAETDNLVLGCSPSLKRTPIMRRRQRRNKMPSSPAMLFSTSLSLPMNDQENQVQKSVVHVRGEVSGDGVADSDSPKVYVVDLQSTVVCSNVTQTDAVSHDCNQNSIGNDMKEAISKDTNECINGVPIGVENVSEELVSNENQETTKAEVHKESVSGGSCEVSNKVIATERQSLQHSISQHSLSSVLSQVSVTSTKSVFSIECEDEMRDVRGMTETEDSNDVTIQTDNTLCEALTPALKDQVVQVCTRNMETLTAVSEDTNDAVFTEGFDRTDGVTGNPIAGMGSMVSLDSVVTADSSVSEADLDSHGGEHPDGIHRSNSRRKLTKSVSLDSGKGLSLDDLANIEEGKLQERVDQRLASERGIKSAKAIPLGLVKMMSDRLSPLEDASEESSCSISSEDNPQFKETKAFWKLAKSGRIFNKSLSESQVGSPQRTSQAVQSKSLHSLVHIQKDSAGRRKRANTQANSSMVKSNINMFNSMCQQISPVKKSEMIGHSGYRQRASTAQSSYSRECQNTQEKPKEIKSKSNLTKAVSIDSGLCNLQDDHDHNDSYEIAQLQGSTVQVPKGQHQARDDEPHTPEMTDQKTTIKYEHPEDMPVHYGDQEADQMPDHLAPIHALHNKSLTPMKLVSSTIIRTPGKRKTIKIKHRSPLKRLQIPNDNTPPVRESRTHKRYPCSPRNPLLHQQPNGRQQMRPQIPSHVRDDMDVVEL
ncbi:rho GTPase-activating protein 11A-like [Asterias rubens]|uniref:rho GTPase-activating protein 11A-like n=1 Tax=Asterias rubens TaxID=7604 RepID=UPI001455304D|nr:rho GTPase-activating protein 11A-like [Asterias rubens]